LADRIAWEKKQIEMMKETDQLIVQRKAKEREQAKAWDKVDSPEGLYYFNRETLER
jgi:hypothetical protein